MNPRHLEEVTKERKAVAPYNFVELPTQIVQAEPQCNGQLRDNDRYYPDRNTGAIKCTLTTQSPLYIRCGMTPDNFAKYGGKPDENLKKEEISEKRKLLADFFQYPENFNPVLPGSSLRGMLRNLVKIIGFGKIEKVSDKQKFFFRAVAAESDDPLNQPYKSQLKDVRSGYLELDKKTNKWFIRPAEEVDEKFFMPVKEEEILEYLPSLIAMKKSNYIPQYLPISFEVTSSSINVSEELHENSYYHKGYLVTGGNMLENMVENSTEIERGKKLSRKEGRKYHYIIGEPNQSATRYEISSDAIENYCNALTDFQKGIEKPFKNNPKNKFDKKMGILKNCQPVFYCEPQGKVITLFGHSPNFRIPYSPNNDGCASSAVDFIPQDVGESDIVDLADAIFGFVRRKKNKHENNSAKNEENHLDKSRAGRIFISDAHTTEQDPWLTGNPNDTITPHILASPKPTTFPHYLVQTSNKKEELKHYASQPNQDTVIRGHKLYWHKGDIRKDCIETDVSEQEIEKKQSQYTEIKPIKSDVSFDFTIYFENLSNIELGILLWILNLTSNKTDQLKLLNLDGKEKYRFSLGMGKPLGMGAVMIEKFELKLNGRYLNETQNRYTQLFEGDNWLIGDRLVQTKEYETYLQKFEEYVIANIHDDDLPNNCNDRKSLCLKDIPRIQMLLAMLSWNYPREYETRYMQIERDTSKDYLCTTKDNEQTINEYKCRLILPTPLQIKQIPDSRKNTTPNDQGNSEGGNENLARQRPQRPKK
ncbi:TIGR03986 family CRISPR-associated RAMP protein [Dolichospermum sp. ST_sed9]|nr:TIGR03986 family CRISPR-associated RAMP protein [Dolichospermum sp. ST_sed9]